MSLNDKLLKAIAAGGITPSENFSIVTYTGDGSNSRTITCGFQPDWVVFKRRDGSDNWRQLDSSRGFGFVNYWNLTNAQDGSASPVYITPNATGFSFTSQGYDNFNYSGYTYVVYCWKANGGTTSSNTDGTITSTVQVNSAAGFSIISYTGSGSAGSVGHGISAGTPDLVIIKRLDGTTYWQTWYNGAGTVPSSGINRLYLNDTQGNDSSTTNVFYPDATKINLNSGDHFFNTSSGNYIAYCFKSTDNFSKIGTYTGTGSATDRPIIETGFEPAFVMIKNASATGSWMIHDNKRNTSNPRDKYLRAESTNAEGTYAEYGLDFFSNGFQVGPTTNYHWNTNGNTYIYMAFAADPDTEAPTLASSFNIETYSGNETTRSITGLGFSPSLIWFKERTSTSNHVFFDVVRGVFNQLYLTTDAQSNNTATVSSFDSDGWSMNNGLAINENSQDYVAWTWKANDDEPAINTNGTVDSIVSVNDNAGFSIVEFTTPASPGSSTRVGHGLSTAPDMILLKRTDGVEDWYVYHTGMGTTKNMRLNTTGAMATATNLFNTVNATVFNPSWTLTGNQKAIAYCFNSVTGYQKFGSYTGDGSAGQTITTGFKPDFILLKSTVGTANWHLYDTRRERGLNQFLQPNNNDPQEEHVGNSNPHLELSSTGFSITADGVTQGNNANGNLYIYWAIAKNVPSNTTLANSFKTLTYTGNGSTQSITGAGFQPDLVWIKKRDATENHRLYDSIRGVSSSTNTLYPSLDFTASTESPNGLASLDTDGFTVQSQNAVNSSGNDFVAWCWKAGNTWQSNIDGTIPSTVNVNTANGFSIVHWYGTQAAGATVGHGLSAVPEWIIVKRLDYAEDWVVYHSSLGNTKTLNLNTNDAEVTDAAFNNTTPTSSVFTLSNCASGSCINSNSGNYIAYCWAPKSGFSKFGSYSSNASTKVSTGFQPDWILMKYVNSANDWFICDSVRSDGTTGSNGGNLVKPVLYANKSDAEVSISTGSVEIVSDGFYPTNFFNSSGVLYMAFKMN